MLRRQGCHPSFLLVLYNSHKFLFRRMLKQETQFDVAQSPRLPQALLSLNPNMMSLMLGARARARARSSMDRKMCTPRARH